MTIKKLVKFFEINNFNVYLTKQDNVQCAEIEKWTDDGIDMIIWLNPFTIEEFENYVNDFNIDETIDLYRQDQRYKNVFTITQSLNDFTNFHNHLKEIALMLVKLK
jgi:hypothetical protein